MRLNASKLWPGLYQGAAPDSARTVYQEGFRCLALCAVEIQPPAHALGTQLTVLRCPLDDIEQLSDADWQSAVECGTRVAHLVSRQRAALVTCAEGRNRSGLVAGVALYLLTGWDGARVVEHIQRRRPYALTNETFARALRGLGDRQLGRSTSQAPYAR